MFNIAYNKIFRSTRGLAVRVDKLSNVSKIIAAVPVVLTVYSIIEKTFSYLLPPLLQCLKPSLKRLVCWL